MRLLSLILLASAAWCQIVQQLVPGKVPSGGGGGTFAFVAATGNISSDSITATATASGGSSCAGSNLIVVACSNAGSGSASDGAATATTPKITDSSTNSYTFIRTDNTGGVSQSSLYYVYNPTVTSLMTFTCSLVLFGTTYPSIAVGCFSGAGSSPLDQQNGTYSPSANFTCNPPNISSAATGELWVSSMSSDIPSGTITASLGTIIYSNQGVGSFAYAIGLSYGILGSSTPLNISQSWGFNFNNNTCSIASFKP
jgi:hypothetical protein